MSKTTQNQTTEAANSDLFADTNISMKTGHLVKDAELIGDGKFVKIRIASNKQYAKDGEIHTTTNYFNALVSKNLTEAFAVAQDLKKGDWIYLKGSDQSVSFDTPEGFKKNDVTMFAYKVALKKAKADQENQQTPEVA